MRQTFVHRAIGERYSYTGLSAVFRRHVKQSGLKDFGLYDLKGKAATDMHRAGVRKDKPAAAAGGILAHTTQLTFALSVRLFLTTPPPSSSRAISIAEPVAASRPHLHAQPRRPRPSAIANHQPLGGPCRAKTAPSSVGAAACAA